MPTEQERNQLRDRLMQLFDEGVITDVCAGYAEPGCEDPKSGFVALADWNARREVEEELEKAGVAVEWPDMWVVCGECHKLVATTPSMCGWTPYFWESQHGVECFNCAKKDPHWFLEYAVGLDKIISIPPINLKKHGFVCWVKELERGLHEFQAADPRVIAKALKKRGITRFIFEHYSSGQFEVYFNVWLDRRQLRKARPRVVVGKPFKVTEMDSAVSPADRCKAQLKGQRIDHNAVASLTLLPIEGDVTTINIYPEK